MYARNILVAFIDLEGGNFPKLRKFLPILAVLQRSDPELQQKLEKSSGIGLALLLAKAVVSL